MKKLLLIITLFLLVYAGTAQENLVYKGIVKVDSTITKSELFDAARKWFLITYNNSKQVLDVSDTAKGILMGKSSFYYNSRILVGDPSGRINYTITIKVKDGRYMYEFADFYHNASHSFGTLTTDSTFKNNDRNYTQKWCNKVWKDIKQQTDTEMKSIIINLVSYMVTVKHDEW